MKTKIRLWLAAAAVAVGAGVTSCSDDDFTASIFDTNAAIDILDRTSYTFPLDTFCKKEFLEPYNLKFIYRFEDKGSDMNKNLPPLVVDSRPAGSHGVGRYRALQQRRNFA